MSKALIIVDFQNDFIEGGALPVKGGFKLTRRIMELVKNGEYDLIVTTQDWHIDPGTHFSETPDYIDSWPVHCVAGTFGAELVKPLEKTLKGKNFVHVYKGQFEDAYSGFQGVSEEEEDLQEILEREGVTEVDVIGLAQDYCVYETALDSSKNFNTRVLLDYTAGINEEKIKETMEELKQAGVEQVRGVKP